MATRKIGIALLVAVLVFLVLQFGITSYSNAQIEAGNASVYAGKKDVVENFRDVKNMTDLANSTPLYAAIGAIFAAGLTLVIFPNSEK